MINTHRNAIIIACACLVFVGIVAAVRFQERSSLPDPTTTPMIQPQYVLKPDPSFFASSTKTSSAYAQPISIPETNAVSASAYLVGNVETGQIYLVHNGSEILPIASMSKLITAIAATDTISPTTTIAITDSNMSVPADGSHIVSGERFTLHELLYPLLLDSSNIAAEAIASSSDRAGFLDLMKSYAWEIGMSGRAFFEDPTGIMPQNAASAKDIFALARYLYKYRPDILALTRVPRIDVGTTTDHGSHSFVSIHPFVNDPNFIGGKTGRTPQAGDTMLTMIEAKDQPIAIVILGARYDGREDDTKILLNEIQNMLR